MPRPRDWYPDTDPKALEVFMELQRKMTPAEKISGVLQMNESVRRSERRAKESFILGLVTARSSCSSLRIIWIEARCCVFYGWYPPVDSDLRGSTKMIAEKRFVVHYKSGETEIVHALQAIQDDEPSGYLVFVDAEGLMKALFDKPIVDCWEESPEAQATH